MNQSVVAKVPPKKFTQPCPTHADQTTSEEFLLANCFKVYFLGHGFCNSKAYMSLDSNPVFMLVRGGWYTTPRHWPLSSYPDKAWYQKYSDMGHKRVYAQAFMSPG